MSRTDSHPRRSRREFLRTLASYAGAAAVVPLLARCGGLDPEQVRREAEQYAGDYSCQDTSGFMDAELITRKANKYTDSSPHETDFCFNCTNFQPVADDNKKQCATCTTVKGPIHPLGWCNAWTQRR